MTKEKDFGETTKDGISGKDDISEEHDAHRKEDVISIAPSRASTSSDHSSSDQGTASPEATKRPVTLARTTSVIPDAVVTPRSQRRGLLARFALIPEVENPYHYTRKTKWLLTFIVAFCAMAAPMGSAIVMPVLQEISVAFHATHTVTNMSVAVYMLSMSIFPLWWSSFSERLGRRTIYIASFILFVVFAILSAVSNSIAMLIVVRTLSGGAAASVQAVGAGTIADIWEVRERGRAMGIFYLGPLCGPLFAPIIGGALGSGLSWRSTQWFLVIYGGATLIFIIFALPETLPRIPRTSTQTTTDTSSDPTADPEKGAARPEIQRTITRASTVQKTKSFLTHMRQIFLDPLKILLWLRYPPVALTVYYASITFGCLYILNISIQATFSAAPYNYPTLIIGLLYIPNSAGYLLASLFGGRWIDAIMHREARKAGRYDDRGKLVFRPEDRMKENAWLSAILWPSALIVYGWTAQYHIHIAVPMIANFLFGIGSMLIFALVNTMLTEFMPKRAASGIALNNFVRNIFSFTGAVVAEPILSAIGNGWFMTILGIWSVVTGCAALAAMGRWSGGWRERMVRELG
ncbi:MFS general substrate transporter [Setomelanomma holmii]|uniref:MFS general substrate transporter n=1 Tax=Setomelanomma holmii TaxID=210430 RepID=A0A9P4H9X4_9PLEO|nr:MFS general substrate transporter [Setomelanomma holmii]